MATAIQQKPCIGCQKGMVTCNGCEKRFCLSHLNEHMQQLEKRMDEVVQEHDQLLDTLKSRDTDSHLFSRINEWEQRSFEKIKETAKQARIDLQVSLDRAKRQIVDSLVGMTEQLKSSQKSNAFAEKELDGWLRQLEQLRQRLEKPVNIEIVESDATGGFIRMIRVIEKSSAQINPMSNEVVAPFKPPSITSSTGE